MPPPHPHHPNNPHSHNHNNNHVPQPPPPKPNPKLLSLILKALIMTSITSLFFLFLGLAAILLFLFLAAAALHRRSRTTQSPLLLLPSSGFSPKHLKSLPQFRFRSHSQTTSSSSSSSSQTDCVVCLDAFRESQWCRKLPGCGHVFHKKCLDTWLVKVSACPICRTRVRLDFGDSASAVGFEGEEEVKYLWSFNRNNDVRVW